MAQGKVTEDGMPEWAADLIGMLATMEMFATSLKDIDLAAREMGHEMAKTVWTYQRDILGPYHPLATPKTEVVHDP